MIDEFAREDRGAHGAQPRGEDRGEFDFQSASSAMLRIVRLTHGVCEYLTDTRKIAAVTIREHGETFDVTQPCDLTGERPG